MNRNITSPDNLLKAINGEMITVTNAELHYDNDRHTESILPEDFVYDLGHYVKSGVFSDSIDFQYKKTGKENLIVYADDMSYLCSCNLTVRLHVNDNVSIDDVERKLTETIFSQESD